MSVGAGLKTIDVAATDERPESEATVLRLLVNPDYGQHRARLIGPDDTALDLPDDLYGVIRFVAETLLAGNGISVIRRDHELTTTQAAEILNVSRPFLIKHLGPDELPFHMVGSHRRIYYNDLLTYQQRLALASEEALQQMVDQAEELGLYKD